MAAKQTSVMRTLQVTRAALGSIPKMEVLLFRSRAAGAAATAARDRLHYLHDAALSFKLL
jgi:hypothetical protein